MLLVNKESERKVLCVINSAVNTIKKMEIIEIKEEKLRPILNLRKMLNKNEANNIHRKT